EFAYPSNALVRALYDFYFTRLLPLIGKLISHDSSAYEYLPTSVKHFIYGADFTSHLESAGFNNTSFKPQTFSISMLYRAKKL
ncbi:MAG: class I SAM-dependent methyltransferase, partial [Bacteroidales bacterium]|nr:class I SAM-dependent methyltransferase [Bacteroidales bacterium]